jgi:SAF domain-containing protein
MTALDERFGSAAVGAALPPNPAAGPSEEPRRRRRGPLLVTGVILVLAALAGAVAVGRAWEARGRVTVWMTATDLAAGAAVTSSDVRRVQLDAVPAGAIAAGASPVGLVTTVPVHAGAVLRRQDVSSVATVVPGSGKGLVGLAGVPGRVPDGLRAGDRVQLVALPPEQPAAAKTTAKPQVLLASAVVREAVSTTTGTTVTLVVPLRLAPTVAALSAANRVALVGLRAG